MAGAMAELRGGTVTLLARFTEPEGAVAADQAAQATLGAGPIRVRALRQQGLLSLDAAVALALGLRDPATDRFQS
jgi:hypothetical protein